jgi:hypothetical protein
MPKKKAPTARVSRRTTSPPRSTTAPAIPVPPPLYPPVFAGYEEPIQFEKAGEIVGIDFNPGESALEGCWLNMNVKFATHVAPEDQKWEIWPQEAIVRLQFSRDGQATFLGAFRAFQGTAIRPSHQSHKSDSIDVTFRRLFSAVQMAVIEQRRSGADLQIKVIVSGFARKGQQSTWGSFREHSTAIPRSRWIDMLGELGILDKVQLAIPVSGDKRLAEGIKYLRSAISHLARAEYPDVAQTCRKAVEEIGLAGFGAKPPSEVRKFLRGQDPTTYSLEERAAVVQTAALLYLHSGSHAGDEERRWRRVDAELALALTAVLLQVAPTRLQGTDSVSATEDTDT